MLGLIFATTLLGQQQVDPNKILDTIIPKVDYKNVEVHSALKELFHRVHAPYRIADPIQGRITLHLENKKFELVLQNILNQASRTYRFEKGKFMILDRGENFNLESWYLQRHVPAFDFRKTDIREAIKELCRSADVTYSIAVEPEGNVGFKLPAGTFGKSLRSLLEPLALTYTFENNTFAFMYKGPRPSREMHYDDMFQAAMEREIAAVDFQDVDIRDAIQELFRTADLKYVLDPRIKGSVTLHLTNTTFDYTLKSLLQYFGGKYHYENGAMQISGHERIFAGGGPEEISLLINGQENNNREKYNFKDTDLREALKLIFRGANASYSIPPDIQGKVTLNATHLQFGDTLYQILDQVDATYRLEGGVFVIVKRQNQPPDGDVFRTPLRQVKFENTDVHEALNSLFERVKLHYIISPDVHGKVTLNLDRTTLGNALNDLMSKVSGSYWFENETLDITSRPLHFSFDLKLAAFLGKTIPIIDFRSIDIMDALKQMCLHAEIPYSFDESLHGKVNLHFVNTKMEVALLNSLWQCSSTIRYRDGALFFCEQPKHKIAIPESLLPNRVDFDFDDVDIRQAIQQIFFQIDANYLIKPQVHGKFSLHVRGLSFRDAFTKMLDQVGATYSYSDGLFTVATVK